MKKFPLGLELCTLIHMEIFISGEKLIILVQINCLLKTLYFTFCFVVHI